jgi:predicted AAA+ superfamily ATPase
MAQNEKSKIFELRLLNRVSEYGLKIPAMSDFKVYFDMFLFDQERLEFLLLKLVQDGEISRSEDNSILIYRLN